MVSILLATTSPKAMTFVRYFWAIRSMFSLSHSTLPIRIPASAIMLVRTSGYQVSSPNILSRSTHFSSSAICFTYGCKLRAMFLASFPLSFGRVNTRIVDRQSLENCTFRNEIAAACSCLSG